MVVVDATEFGAEGFDPKRWINAALDARLPSEPLDRFLADAKERLRAAADDAGAALERDSADALRRVPLACRDALRLRDDALALRSHLATVIQSLSQEQPNCSSRLKFWWRDGNLLSFKSLQVSIQPTEKHGGVPVIGKEDGWLAALYSCLVRTDRERRYRM